MRPAASDSPGTSTESGRASIKLRDDHFVLVTNFLGVTDDTKRARFCGLSLSSIYRARGGGDVSDIFIAATLAALEPHRERLAKHNIGADFDSLFELDVARAAA